ncbi:MAG: class 1 fructose-bisphosphatase [Candidatus Competibacteraceae bacterium]|nr:class 1 fructose-bisphosphatase [Candidatus Competibacteraceae bacterium]
MTKSTESRITLTQFLRTAWQPGDLQDSLPTLLDTLAAACCEIAAIVSQGQLADVLGNSKHCNSQGEQQKKLDLLSNDILIRHAKASGLVAALVSEELPDVLSLRPASASCPYLLSFDPLDGSSNVDVNGLLGTIFSVLPAPLTQTPVDASAFLQVGARQLCAAYAIYGPSTMLIITFGQGTQGFTLDHHSGDFLLTHPDIRIPVATQEFAINASYQRFWEAPVQRFIEECQAGQDGPLGKDFNMRWSGAMIGDVHRVIMRGGVFLYPLDQRNRHRGGRLRLLYEANPVSWLVEQAGGLSTTGSERILALTPHGLHQRCPLILGSREEIRRIQAYYQQYQPPTPSKTVLPHGKARFNTSLAATPNHGN